MVQRASLMDFDTMSGGFGSRREERTPGAALPIVSRLRRKAGTQDTRVAHAMQRVWMERIRPRKPQGAFSPLLAFVALRKLSNSMFTVADQDHVQDPFDFAEVRPMGEGATPPQNAKTIQRMLIPRAATASFTPTLIAVDENISPVKKDLHVK